RRYDMTRELLLSILMAILMVAMSMLYPAAFPTLSNFSAVLRNLAADGIMACGMMLLLVAGTFDLSIGGVFSLSGVVAGSLMKEAGIPVPIAVAAALAVALLGGLLNGVIVAHVKVNALIATLGTMGIYRGIAVLLGGPGINFLPQSFSGPGRAV